MGTSDNQHCDRLVVEITPEMVGAGVRALFAVYGGAFDASNADPELFVRRLYGAMAVATDPNTDQGAAQPQ